MKLLLYLLQVRLTLILFRASVSFHQVSIHLQLPETGVEIYFLLF